jgi:hypothetical protein
MVSRIPDGDVQSLNNFSFLELVPRTRFCNRCGNPNIVRMTLQMTYYLKTHDLDNERMRGLMSDMSKISNGEWKEVCLCLPVFAAINLPFR